LLREEWMRELHFSMVDDTLMTDPVSYENFEEKE
jgi:hypothetical protein